MNTGVKFKPKGQTEKNWKNPDKDTMLRIIDQLREKVEAGETIDHFEIIREVSIL